ncbi:MAG: hypothetical protein GY835_07000 [bacterium]|nr:hypothetical protein [bacterium]
MSLYRKGADLLSLTDLSDEEITELLAFTRELKGRYASGDELQLLTGVQLFLFDLDRVLPAWNPYRLAMEQLGGRAHEIEPSRINLNWNETYLDLFAQLDRTGHGLAISSIRSGEGQSFIEDTAELMSRPVFNMLSDSAAPCQALASLLAVEERIGRDMSGATASIVWAPPGVSPKPAALPLSLAELCVRRDIDLRLACPSEFHPGEEFCERMDSIVPGGLQVTDDPIEAIADSNLVFSLNWGVADNEDAMVATRQETERYSGWRMGTDRFAFANQGALLGGGLPQGRGTEIEEQLLEIPQAIHLEEAENLLHVVKAVLALTLDLCLEQNRDNEAIQ